MEKKISNWLNEFELLIRENRAIIISKWNNVSAICGCLINWKTIGWRSEFVICSTDVESVDELSSPAKNLVWKGVQLGNKLLGAYNRISYTPPLGTVIEEIENSDPQELWEVFFYCEPDVGSKEQTWTVEIWVESDFFQAEVLAASNRGIQRIHIVHSIAEERKRRAFEGREPSEITLTMRINF